MTLRIGQRDTWWGGAMLAGAIVLAALGWWRIAPLPTPVLALVLTIAIETPLLVLLLRADRDSLGKILLTGVLINALTHPLVWTAIMTHTLSWTVAEGATVLVEGALLALLSQRPFLRMLGVSLIVNAVTAFLGLVLVLP